MLAHLAPGVEPAAVRGVSAVLPTGQFRANDQESVLTPENLPAPNPLAYTPMPIRPGATRVPRAVQAYWVEPGGTVRVHTPRLTLPWLEGLGWVHER